MREVEAVRHIKIDLVPAEVEKEGVMEREESAGSRSFSTHSRACPAHKRRAHNRGKYAKSTCQVESDIEVWRIPEGREKVDVNLPP
ncbi:hypothetical protein NQZ68_002545 [Dissostichus eleginoides]|nr:hypothetical protein NQZ68_002545 [Dissostichus eleginoides]